MTPQVKLNGTNRVDDVGEVESATASKLADTQVLTEKDRQGLAMAWVFSALGFLLVLGGLALLAAWVFQAGFVGWLIGMALMGLVIVGVIVAVNNVVLRPAR
jgi:hypothetical protein